MSQIRVLGFYSRAEWKEYIDHFEDGESIWSHLAAHAGPVNGDIRSRIVRGEGADPSSGRISSCGKVVSLGALRERREALGIVSGVFDLLHLGHLRLFAAAERHVGAYAGAKVCALVLPDEAIKRKKGPPRPIMNLQERLTLLSSVRALDYIVPLASHDCVDAIQCLRPLWFFKVEVDREQPAVRKEIVRVKSVDGSVILLERTEPRLFSTTAIIHHITHIPIGEEDSGGSFREH